MVREDILGGLKTGLARGQTLREAMMTFYNAGYLKQEIEDAARVAQEQINNPSQPQFVQTPLKPTPIFQRGVAVKDTPNERPKEIFSQTAKFPVKPAQTVQAKTVQKVSAYGSQPKPVQQAQPTQIKQSTQQTQAQPKQVQSQPVQQPAKTVQKVSAYGAPKQVQQPLTVKPKGKGIIFILLALLVLLIGGLIALFFFKQELLSFFGSA